MNKLEISKNDVLTPIGGCNIIINNSDIVENLSKEENNVVYTLHLVSNTPNVAIHTN